MVDLNSPLISVVLSCYNRESLICDAVDSALGQTYPNIEVIVIDDGSTDRSLEVLKKYGERIQVYSQQNQGACAARNHGLRRAKGEYLQFLDSDDFLCPDKIETQLKIMRQKGVDIVVCRSNIMESDGSSEPCGYYPDTSNYDALDYLIQFNLSTNGPLHRRSRLLEVGGFREGLPKAQEWDLHVRLGLNGAKLAKIDDVLFTIRRHSGPSISSKVSDDDTYMLRTLSGLIKYCEKNQVDIADWQYEIFAKHICLYSIYGYRNGYVNDAKMGFEYAKALSSKFIYPERYWLQMIARIIGANKTEFLLSWFRSIKYSFFIKAKS